MNLDYIRGSIWWSNLPSVYNSSVQSGYRPVVIISSQAGCSSSDVVQICPITTKLKSLQVNVDIHPVANDVPNQVLTNQIMTVSKSSLSKPSGYLTKDELEKVEKGILISLGMFRPVSSVTEVNKESLVEAKNDREELEKLLPQAKDLISKLSNLVNKLGKSNTVPRKSNRVKMTPEEIRSFIREWEDPYNSKAEVAEAFGFAHYNTAWNFHKTNKKKLLEGKLGEE